MKVVRWTVAILIGMAPVMQAATAYFNTEAAFAIEYQGSPSSYVRDLYNNLLEGDGSNKYQADLKLRTIYTGNVTTPYSVDLTSSTRFVDQGAARDMLQNSYNTTALQGSTINGLVARNAIILSQLGISSVDLESGVSTSDSTAYGGVFMGGPSTDHTVRLTMDFVMDESLDFKEIQNFLTNLTEEAFGPIAQNSYPFAATALVEDWTLNTNDGQPGVVLEEVSGSYERTFYFATASDAANYGQSIYEEEQIMLTLASRSIGPFAGFNLLSSSTNAVPEPSACMYSFFLSMLVWRRGRCPRGKYTSNK